jgi:hypothetical protein
LLSLTFNTIKQINSDYKTAWPVIAQAGRHWLLTSEIAFNLGSLQERFVVDQVALKEFSEFIYSSFQTIIPPLFQHHTNIPSSPHETCDRPDQGACALHSRFYGLHLWRSTWWSLSKGAFSFLKRPEASPYLNSGVLK